MLWVAQEEEEEELHLSVQPKGDDETVMHIWIWDIQPYPNMTLAEYKIKQHIAIGQKEEEGRKKMLHSEAANMAEEDDN